MLIVFSTASSSDEAKLIARKAVSLKLAACVQLIPKITSIYEWKDEIHEDEEVLMLFKTKNESFDSLCSLIEQEHSYDTPEIVAVESEHVSENYRIWLEETLA